MFGSCYRLNKAPERLPATKLARAYYSGMFDGCSNLAKVKVSFTDWKESDIATKDWLDGVKSSGTFICPTGLDTSIKDSSHVPSGWTVNP